MGRSTSYATVGQHRLATRMALYWQMQIKCRPLDSPTPLLVHLSGLLVAVFSLFDLHSKLLVGEGACCQSRLASYRALAGWVGLAIGPLAAGRITGLGSELLALPVSIGVISAAACLDAVLKARKFADRPQVVLTDLVRLPNGRQGSGKALLRSISTNAQLDGARVGGVAMNERLVDYYLDAGLQRDLGNDPRLVVGRGRDSLSAQR